MFFRDFFTKHIYGQKKGKRINITIAENVKSGVKMFK